MFIEKSVLPGELLPAHLTQPHHALPVQPPRRLQVTHETPSLDRRISDGRACETGGLVCSPAAIACCPGQDPGTRALIRLVQESM